MYRVALIADNHFVRSNGKYYVNGTYTEQYLKRFTSNFDTVLVIARCRKATSEEEVENLRLSGGEGVKFLELDDFYGTKQYIVKRRAIKEKINDAFSEIDAVFVRMPCILTTLAIACCKNKELPYMLDVGADPDTIYRSARPSIFEILLSKYMKNVCEKACLEANGVSYVTKDILQRKYPCRAMIAGESVNAFTESISNADISAEFYGNSRDYSKLVEPLRILHISNNISANSGKGHLECIEVLKELKNRNIEAKITFVGGGDNSEIVKLAKEYGLDERISFTGRIADRNDYRKVILEHDIFLFPSHSEGLPRVLLEVMATGMVCVSSNVDGIPEILESRDIYRYDDIDGMSNRIEQLLSDRNIINSIRDRNFFVAKQYSDEMLRQKYNRFYGKVRQLLDTL